MFQQTAALWHLCQHPTWAIAAAGRGRVVWRTPDTPDNAGAFAKSKTVRGTQYPQVRMLCQMELTSHLLAQTVDWTPVR